MWPHATLIVYKSVIVAPAEPLNCAMLVGVVGLIVRWIPLTTAAYGTRVARGR